MSIARHHAEWLSLLEISGPFLSMPVLMDAFPQGLDARDPVQAGELRAAYEEWADNQGGLQPDPAIHTAWVRYVLENTLEMPPEVVAEGQAIPEGIKATIPEHGEVLRPDLIVTEPDGGRPRLLIQVYPPDQDLEKVLPNRAWKASPATRMMELLHATEVRLGLMTNGEWWMLVHAPRGETTAFISWYASLWLEEPLTLRAFHTLLGVERFFNVPDDQTLEALLEASAKDQHEVTDQLGYQVRQAVEILVQAIDRADQDRGGTLLTSVDEERLYETALTVMMRLVFLLSAEERGLLLLGDPAYDQHYAVSTLRAQLREMADQHGEEVMERRFDAWCRLLAAFRAVYGGVQHEDLRLPAYGGSLFDPDRFAFLEGREPGTHWRTAPADPLPINNRTVLHLLEALQVLQVKVPGGGAAEARRLSFRALDIEQIGHVYEGLLDHVAVRAEEPVLGLVGTKNKEPEIPLPDLEVQQANDEAALVKFLRGETGRSPGALKKALGAAGMIGQSPLLDALRAERVRAACGNDGALYRRVLPFAGLVRDDDVGFPVVILPGSVYVTAGPTRRATGTHYTPRSLTEPIVQHTLEPLVYDGPAEGKPREEWELHHPAAILDLKVCDMAMGSGAFLVQACRYLSERLVEAWDSLLPQSDRESGVVARVQITPEGKPASGDPGETIIPPEGEERLTLARRLVADRCLYGVDKNHLAVEMAKLSLWLITLDKNRSFSFLDHALKHGDSIVGADENMFLRWAQSLRDSAMPLFAESLREELATARAKRRELQSFEVREVADAERKAHLLAEAEAATERIKLGCDLLVGARLLDDLTPAQQDTLLANALLDYVAGKPFTDESAERAVAAARRIPTPNPPFAPALHWPFAFPEVFAQGGFSSFVGNPPFIGGMRIRSTLGNQSRQALYILYPGSSGNADYCAFFFLRGYANLRRQGTLGLIATNTIAQGDTRETGLGVIAPSGATIFRATNDQAWPGQATVTVNIVHIAKGRLDSPFVLDDQFVDYISSYLGSRRLTADPHHLNANADRSFIGSYILGLGFTMSPDDAEQMIGENPKNADVLFPYLSGQDFNSDPEHTPSRWVVNFFDWSLEKAETYTECIEIVRHKVKPQRDKVRRKRNRERWWLYAENRPGLYQTIQPLDRVMVCARTSKYLSFGFVPKGWVYNENVVVLAFETFPEFAMLQSTLHFAWTEQYSSTLETRQGYRPSDCFETFPLAHPSQQQDRALNQIGEAYHEHRCQIMLARQEGLTKTYNRFHDPDEAAEDIARLRELHVEMDRAVAAAYGWDPAAGSGQGLDLGHGFHETAQGVRFTISEPARREVLTRLLELNHERYAEEVRQGLHEKKREKKATRKRSSRRKSKAEKNQPRLF